MWKKKKKKSDISAVICSLYSEEYSCHQNKSSVTNQSETLWTVLMNNIKRCKKKLKKKNKVCFWQNGFVS